MALLASGTSVEGRVITSIQPTASQALTLYFPDIDFSVIRYLGGIFIAQVDTPIAGVYRQEQWEKVYTYSTRYEPIRGGSARRIGLQFALTGFDWQLHS